MERIWSECETNEELEYARLASKMPTPGLGIGMLATNTFIPGYLDYKERNKGDQFTVDGNLLSAASFGNFSAGYSGFYALGPFGVMAMHAGGEVFDILDRGFTLQPDSDSREDIDNGANRAFDEMRGVRSVGCGCPK